MEIITLDHRLDSSIYRFFDDATYADEFVKGNIKISTLEACRGYEDELQGDSHEAKHTYFVGETPVSSDSDNFQSVAKNLGFKIETFGNGVGTISNCQNIKTIEDAFVLCTTRSDTSEMLQGTFGQYCVEISSPKRLFTLITRELRRKTDIRQAARGDIIYENPRYSGSESAPGPLGFVKRRDKYSHQKEYRFLWTLKNREKIEPFVISIPNARNICKRIR